MLKSNSVKQKILGENVLNSKGNKRYILGMIVLETLLSIDIVLSYCRSMQFNGH